MKKLSVALLVGVMMLGITRIGSGQEISGDIAVFPKYAAIDSTEPYTPFAVYITASGLTPGQTYNYAAWVYGGKVLSKIWKAVDGAGWKGSYYYIDFTPSSSDWGKWVYLYIFDAPNEGYNYYLKYKMRQNTTDLIEVVKKNNPDGFTLMDMSSSGTGAWVEDSGNPPQGYVVLAYSNSDILGAYAAENNNVSEGYDSTSGYWKIAVPAGASITKLEARDTNNDIYATDTAPSWTAGSAGTTTELQDVSLPVTLSAFTAIPTDSAVILKWRTESEVDNLGWDIYRSEKKDGKFIKINDELIPGAGNSAMPNTYQFVDKTVVKGRQYYYYLEDIDIAGMRNKSSIIPISKDAKKLTTTWGKIKKG